MKQIARDENWPESWKLSHRFDQEELWGPISNRGYAYAYESRRQQTLALMQGVLQPGASVSRGGKTQAITRFRQAQEWLLEEAKKGRAIQRFKGLGEMNPEQLWDTTVNPETRRLLKVRIEDAVAADQIFSTLMGDVVEPRREFIEENALRVGNLDV